MKKFIMQRGLAVLPLLLILLLLVLATPKFPGLSIPLSVLTASFIALLFLAKYKNLGYGYAFLTLFLFLGFWIKPVFHLIYPFPYSEPVGGFADLPAEWNEIMKVSISGIWGVIFAGLLVQKLIPNYFIKNKVKSFMAPSWYLKVRKYLWIGFALSLVFVALFNTYFGIHQIGLPVETKFIWPTNALISLMLVSGFSIVLATLLWWDISLGISISKSSYWIVFESLVSSISLLSRGVMLFHSLPLLISLWNFRDFIKGMSNKRILSLLATVFLLLPICYFGVNYLREYRYFGYHLEMSQVHLDHFAQFLKFSIDRWVGIEGLMAVVSYPDKSFNLFIKGLLETGSNPMGGIYQWISSSHYRLMDMDRFIFAAVPGPIGFFYYSGSLALVFLGMFTLTIALVLFEITTFRLTANPILCSFYGFSLALLISQFGVYPSNSIPYVTFLFASMILISLLQFRMSCIRFTSKGDENV